ncbi:DeoR family transcriptional regulator [Carboxydothermus islandicus]|uniref:DeoR family transcriptional regulator n=1 Tax=Carboxydothermus islandicus TaxID=661089 RepID=A0A1L8D1L0_9THEO|nr:transcription factor FapR [Carboxydothermus islandicus]GAV24997.1 DeoR family transcriptional regulator [Carboxydothermus islandicus]
MNKSPKARRKKLLEIIEKNPFLTDEQLAATLGVSVQTIRLDRMILAIPEQRERIEMMAQRAYQNLTSLTKEDIIGRLILLEPGEKAASMLEITPEMCFKDGNIARGHFLFAQANSLAVALCPGKNVLTGIARVSFKKPVCLGQKVIATAMVREKKQSKYYIKVTGNVENEIVYVGRFVVFKISREG